MTWVKACSVSRRHPDPRFHDNLRCHCEERSDEAIHPNACWIAASPRRGGTPRNDKQKRRRKDPPYFYFTATPSRNDAIRSDVPLNMPSTHLPWASTSR